MSDLQPFCEPHLSDSSLPSNHLQSFLIFRRAEFEAITEGLSDALDFSRTIGVDSGRESISFEQGGGRGVLGEVDFYTRCG
jgi:hypothetical protein